MNRWRRLIVTGLLAVGPVLLVSPGLALAQTSTGPRSPAQSLIQALVGLYEAADGWIALDVETDAEWAALAGALGEPAIDADPRFADTAARAINDAALTDQIGGHLRTASADSWIKAFTDEGVPAAPVLGLRALTLRDAAVADNGWATEVSDPDLGRLRGHIAIVPQETFLFSATIEENIAYGVDRATQDTVERAARAAGIDGEVRGFPDGYARRGRGRYGVHACTSFFSSFFSSFCSRGRAARIGRKAAISWST